MSTKFFTNENENTLINKIEGVFKHRNIHFFDALVGYFRASGYFRIRPFVEKADEIRILVGINVDNLIYEANKKGLLFIEDPAKSKDDFFEEIKQNIQSAEFNYTGHTPYLKNLFEVKDVAMMMVADNMRVALLTEHVAIKDVAQFITK